VPVCCYGCSMRKHDKSLFVHKNIKHVILIETLMLYIYHLDERPQIKVFPKLQ
jgi:hypothetical protein